MERRRFIASMSAALVGPCFLAENSFAQEESNTVVATQTSESDGRATRRTKTFGSFTLLPAAAVRPEGWLRHYAQINADTWLLMYARNREPQCYDEYRSKRTIKDQGDFTDYIGYFGLNLVHYASMLPDSRIAAEVEPWIKSVLECQEDNGYLGGFAPGARWRNWLETWALAWVLNALLTRYEVTGDKSLLAASEKAAGVVIEVVSRSSNEAPVGDFYRGGAEDNSTFGPIAKGDLYSSVSLANGGIMLAQPLGKLYALTGKESYLKFARAYLYRFGKVQAYLSGGDQVVHHHAVIEAVNVATPAYLYEYAGDPQMLKASQAGWEMMQPYLSVAGAPHGGEMLFSVGSRANSTHMNVVDWIKTSGTLARMTGEVKYADAVERVMFNAYPAAKSPDGWTLAYMHTPNQLVAAEWSSPTLDNTGDVDTWAKSRQYYTSAQEPLCCNLNSPLAIPLFVESMVVGSKDGLSFLYYGPCTVSTSLPQAGAIKISVDTRYPFEDQVRIILRLEHASVFPVQFRVPGWCVTAGVEINGTKYEGPMNPGTFATISRRWESGDQIIVKFENTIRLRWGGAPEAGVRVRCAVVERGPLVYTLRVPEQWRAFQAPDHGPGKEEDIKSYRLLPTKDAVWNYALIVDRDHPEKDMQLKQLEVDKDASPWDGSSPIGLSVKARRVVNWQMEGDPDHPMTPGFPFHPMKCSDEIETVTLVPFGHARLRMTYLPIIEA